MTIVMPTMQLPLRPMSESFRLLNRWRNLTLPTRTSATMTHSLLCWVCTLCQPSYPPSLVRIPLEESGHERRGSHNVYREPERRISICCQPIRRGCWYLSSNANVVAEAVNVISLEAFFGLIRLNVILRGDAIPLTVDEREYCEDVAASKAEERGTRNAVGKLSDLVVRAKFDPPRIVFGRKGRILNLNLGPRSSVVLDTTYCDNALRIGKGGTSGTKFVFKRLGSDDEEASEWRSLLTRRPLRKSKALVVLGSVLGWGIQSAVRDKARVLGLSLSAVASVLGAMFVFSSGGIEQDS